MCRKESKIVSKCVWVGKIVSDYMGKTESE